MIEVKEMRESPRGRSMLKLYQACPLKWYFKYGRGFKLKDSADHLIHGSAIHEAQAVYYTSGFDEEAMYEKLHTFLASYGRLDLEVKGTIGLTMWVKYIGSLDKELVNVLEVEEEDEIVLANGFRISLRRDRVLEYRDSREIFINDTKTTGYSLAGAIREYMYSDQPRLYIASIRQTHPEWNKRLSGWRTDAIYMRALKNPKGGDDKDGFSKLCERSPVSTFTDEEIDATLKGYAVQTSDMAYKLKCVIDDGDAPSDHFFPCNANCMAFNRPCEYYSFCHEVDTIEHPPANFIIDEWLAEGTVLDAFKNLKE